MKLGKKLAVLAFGLSVMGTAAASEEYIASSGGFDIYLLSDRVKNEYDTRKTVKSVWFKYVVDKDLVQDGLGVGDYTLLNYYFQCDNSRYSLIKWYEYAKNKEGVHKLINEYKQPNSVFGYDYQEVIPYTVGEDMLNHVCENY